MVLRMFEAEESTLKCFWVTSFSNGSFKCSESGTAVAAHKDLNTAVNIRAVFFSHSKLIKHCRTYFTFIRTVTKSSMDFVGYL